MQHELDVISIPEAEAVRSLPGLNNLFLLQYLVGELAVPNLLRGNLKTAHQDEYIVSPVIKASMTDLPSKLPSFSFSSIQ
jgi:hypothetical protein